PFPAGRRRSTARRRRASAPERRSGGESHRAGARAFGPGFSALLARSNDRDRRRVALAGRSEEDEMARADRIGIGMVGAGSIARARHVPGFKAIPGVELVGVVNRTPESSKAAARELGFARTY